MTQKEQSPMIMSDQAIRNSGKLAQRNNILAAKLVAETVRTTLGPRGMDKMVVDAAGQVIVTNDGVTILEEMDIAHPAAKMIVEVARTQEDEVGDGTTTAVVLAGELLKNAESLLDDNIHPTVIISGYRLAESHAQKILQTLSTQVTLSDEEILLRIAETAMTGKGAENAKRHLARLAVDSVKEVHAGSIDLEDIKIESQHGASTLKSKLIKGVVLDKERVHTNMPTGLDDAKVLLVNFPLELKETEVDARVSISTPQQMQEYIDMEESMLTKLVDRIVQSGATLVCCQKGIDDMVAYKLAKKGIVAVRRVSKRDLARLGRATGAQVVTDQKDITSEVLGKAGSVEERRVGDERMIFIEDCAHPKAVTILVRAGTSHVVHEVERALSDAIGDIRATLEKERAVGGAGAIEIALSASLEQYARTLQGREQLAVLAYAKAIDVIPRTLAENAGLDPIDVLTDLRNAHSKGQTSGINVESGRVIDSWQEGIIEPLQIKTQALASATDVATMILRIDDVIVNERVRSERPSLDE